MNVSRRTLLAGASAFALVLAGCNGTTGNQAVSQVATDVATIATGLQGSLTALGSNTLVAGPTLAKFGNYVADLRSLAAELATAASGSAQQPLVQQVSADINAIIGVLATLPPGVIPPQVQLGLQAALVLLPVIETAVGLVVTPPPAVATTVTAPVSTPAGARRAGASAPITTPDQARAYLTQIGQQAL